jgi:transposase
VHTTVVAAILAKLEFLDEQIEHLSEQIGQLIAPFADKAELLTTVPGIGRRTAEAILAEIGIEMAAFPTAAALASWAGVCPGNHQSAGRNKSGRIRKGSKWLDAALHEAAMAASRTKGTYLSAQYARLRARRGHAKAIRAVQHSILVAIWHMLTNQVPYQDLGADYFQRRNTTEHQAKRLVNDLKKLGYHVTVEAPARAA